MTADWMWAQLLAGSLLLACVAGTIAHHRDVKALAPAAVAALPPAPYRMDIDEAMHRRWQTMHPVRHRADGIATTALGYVPRHGVNLGAVTQEFQRIVSAAWPTLAGAA